LTRASRSAWIEQQWFPLVSEKLDLEMTSVGLPMVSLIPENIEKELRDIVGDNYCELKELDRTVLVLAHQFGEIYNADIQVYTQEHPRDIGECLKRHVKNGWLEQFGRGRGTHYALPNQSQSNLLSLIPSEHYEPSSEHYERLRKIAAPIRDKGRTGKELVEQVILKLCSEHYLQLRTLAELLGREPDSIRNHYVNPMLSKALLELKHPEQINHPQQAYRTVLARNQAIKKASDASSSHQIP
jgi:ATP-dependent DNA helicase RecG